MLRLGRLLPGRKGRAWPVPAAACNVVFLMKPT